MRVPFKLLICASDKPGSLLLMLNELSGEKLPQGNVGKGQVTIYEPSLHMFTFKRCERFTPIYSQDVYTGSVILMKPKYAFHFIIELLQDKTQGQGKRENTSNHGTTSASKTDKIAIMEVHICINAHYYGINVSVFKKIIEAFSAAKCNGRNNKIIFCPGLILQNNSEGVINYGLLMFPRTADRDIVSSISKVISRLIVNNNPTCVIRSTCPIAQVRVNEEKFRELYGEETMDYHILRPSNNHGDSEVRVPKLYITFARDHECYESDKTFAEYYGIIEEDYKDTSGSNNYDKKQGSSNIINAIIICPHFIKEIKEKEEAPDILEDYIKSVLSKLKEHGIIGEYLMYFDRGEDRKIGVDRCVYIYSTYFTCDDPRCELVQESLPTITLNY